jgi:hypothetical protein
MYFSFLYIRKQEINLTLFLLPVLFLPQNLQDTHKLQAAESEIERLSREVARLEEEVELRVSHNDYESAFEEAERENAVHLLLSPKILCFLLPFL